MKKEEQPEDIKRERDALLSVVQYAQRGQQIAERIIDLLIAGGHVTRETVEAARNFAILK